VYATPKGCITPGVRLGRHAKEVQVVLVTFCSPDQKIECAKRIWITFN
jgi:hypothetical protein